MMPCGRNNKKIIKALKAIASLPFTRYFFEMQIFRDSRERRHPEIPPYMFADPADNGTITPLNEQAHSHCRFNARVESRTSIPASPAIAEPMTKTPLIILLVFMPIIFASFFVVAYRPCHFCRIRYI